jgi:ribosomal subunit interface protein
MSDASEIPIEFKGRHDQISERMKSHATEKIKKLGRFRDWLSRIEVVADHAHENPEVELIAHLRKGGPLVSKDRSTSFSATIDLLVDKMDSLLRKQKGRVTDRKGNGGKPHADVDETGGKAGSEAETYEEIVRRTMRE